MRPTQDEILDGIIDAAAATFARHGIARTSVQQIADAVGYSKTGLLHHFPSKQALIDSVLARMESLAASIATDELLAMPSGPVRDLAAIRATLSVTLANPGMAALLSSTITAPEGDPAHDLTAVFVAKIVDAFWGPGSESETRGMNVAVALGGLLSASISWPADKWTETEQEHLIAAVARALGHA